MSIQLFVMDKMMRLAVKRRFRRDPNIMTLRGLMKAMAKEAKPPPAPAVLEAVTLGGIAAEKLSVPGSARDKAILYIHGGGFVGGEPATHRTLTWRLAAETKVPVYAIDYRLAPEHPFPAALEDCVAAYRALLDDHKIAARHIAIGGDSAGGNLALATAIKLRADGIALPGCLVCLSPVVDLSEAQPSHISNAKRDALFDVRTFPTATPIYSGAHNPADPLISPIRGDVSGLPPTFFQCSRDEMLRDDSIRMAEKINAAGGDATLDVWPNVYHVWQLGGDILPEAREAIARLAKFVTAHLYR
jgi:acetyl esterase/lipase